MVATFWSAVIVVNSFATEVAVRTPRRLVWKCSTMRRLVPSARRAVAPLVELTGCSSCCQRLASPLMADARGRREPDPTGESAAGPAGLDHFPQAPHLGTIALRWLSGSGLKSCPRNQLATK